MKDLNHPTKGPLLRVRLLSTRPRFDFACHAHPREFALALTSQGSALRAAGRMLPRMTQSWTFAGTWPHAPQWFDTTDGRMHYIDVGPRTGRPVVLVHGNPSWGYLFRHFIAPLVAAGHRVIVPDHLGFGRSDKPDRAGVYSTARHVARFESLLESLQLEKVTLVPHDWGGPIALAWAGRHPERIASLVLLGTFAHRPPGRVPMPLPLRLFRMRGIGELFVRGLHAILRGFLFGGGTMRRERLGPSERAAYQAPHPTWASRAAILAFAREFPAGPDGAVADLIDAVHGRLAALATRPTLIVWAGRDAVFGPDVLAAFRADFPAADVLEVPEAGHFIQEDAHEIVVPALVAFLEDPRNQQS